MSADSAPLSPMSLRAYAKRRGVSAEAVSKAIATGRLRECVVRIGGAPKIADPDLADTEWRSNSLPLRGDLAGAGDQADGTPNLQEARAWLEAHKAREKLAQAQLAEIELAERRGELIPAAQARDEMVTRITAARNRLLGLPSRLAQRMPDLAARVVPVAEEAIREVLEDLARGVDGAEAEQ